MNKNEKVKIDINGSISDSAKGITQDAAGMSLIAIILLFLFAPATAPLFEVGLDNKYMLNGMPDVDRIKIEKAKIRRRLWIVCAITWTSFILCNLYWTY